MNSIASKCQIYWNFSLILCVRKQLEILSRGHKTNSRATQDPAQLFLGMTYAIFFLRLLLLFVCLFVCWEKNKNRLATELNSITWNNLSHSFQFFVAHNFLTLTKWNIIQYVCYFAVYSEVYLFTNKHFQFIYTYTYTTEIRSQIHTHSYSHHRINRQKNNKHSNSLTT